MIRKLIRIHVFSPLKRALRGTEMARYFRAAAEPKINVGCGKNVLPGWLNVDLYPMPGAVQMDVAARWPVRDGVFSACFCEHMIEHIPQPAAEKMIAEMFRTLRPGGLLRIVTPDLEFFARLALGQAGEEGAAYKSGLERFTNMPGKSALDCVNEIFYGHGHRRIYTVQALCGLLRKAGFEDIDVMRGGTSRTPIFDGVDGHPRVLGHEMNAIEAFAIEARKRAV